MALLCGVQFRLQANKMLLLRASKRFLGRNQSNVPLYWHKHLGIILASSLAAKSNGANAAFNPFASIFISSSMEPHDMLAASVRSTCAVVRICSPLGFGHSDDPPQKTFIISYRQFAITTTDWYVARKMLAIPRACAQTALA